MNIKQGSVQNVFSIYFLYQVVAKWRKQKVLWKVSLQTEAVSAAYHPSTATVGVGTLDGHVVVLNAETGAHVTTVRVCGAAVNALAYNKVSYS